MHVARRGRARGPRASSQWQVYTQSETMAAVGLHRRETMPTSLTPEGVTAHPSEARGAQRSKTKRAAKQACSKTAPTIPTARQHNLGKGRKDRGRSRGGVLARRAGSAPDCTVLCSGSPSYLLWEGLKSAESGSKHTPQRASLEMNKEARPIVEDRKTGPADRARGETPRGMPVCVRLPAVRTQCVKGAEALTASVTQVAPTPRGISTVGRARRRRAELPVPHHWIWHNQIFKCLL